jgi:hypothetical protein
MGKKRVFRGALENSVDAKQLILGQFITLSTPHLGSVIADYAVFCHDHSDAAIANLSTAMRLTHGKGPIIQKMLVTSVALARKKYGEDYVSGTGATRNLTTSFMYEWGTPNMGILLNYTNSLDNTKPKFWAVGADADLNGDKKISWSRETEESRKWDGLVIGTLGPPSAYDALLKVEKARGEKALVTGLLLLVEDAYQEEARQPNDFLVTYNSAFGSLNLFKKFTFYQGAKGKMHGNVGDKSVGRDLLWSFESVIPSLR